MTQPYENIQFPVSALALLHQDEIGSEETSTREGYVYKSYTPDTYFEKVDASKYNSQANTRTKITDYPLVEIRETVLQNSRESEPRNSHKIKDFAN